MSWERSAFDRRGPARCWARYETVLEAAQLSVTPRTGGHAASAAGGAAETVVVEATEVLGGSRSTVTTERQSVGSMANSERAATFVRHGQSAPANGPIAAQ
jgi:hypothetical protein